MKAYYQQSIKENGVSALKNLLKVARIHVTNTSIGKIFDSPDYPSLHSLSNALDEWDCENIGVKLTVSQLAEIPYPAIAHLSKNNGHFVVLTEFGNGSLKYIDPEIGIVNEPIDEFEKKWTGVALLVQPNEKSGEEGYAKKRRFEIIGQVKKISIIALESLLLLVTGFFVSLSLLPLLILKVIGAGLCFLLLQEQFGSTNYSKAICHIGKNTDCGAVINSPASMVFGVIHLSELGALYFLGGLISLSVSAFTNHSIVGLLTILNWLALPYTFFSVYYQWQVIKKWCPLCLLVVAIFWLEFFSLNYHLQRPVINTASIFIALFGFSIPLIFWLAARQPIMDSFALPNLERRLNRFLKSDKIFQTLLQTQPSVSMGKLTHPIVAGAENPPIKLTIVSSPTCAPCAAAYFASEALLNNFSDKLSVEYRFLVRADDDSISTKMVRHLVALSLTKSEEEVSQALSQWYMENGKGNFEKWSAAYPIKVMPSERLIDSIINEQFNWCLQAGIKATPTIFINDKTMPEEFSFGDLKFQLRNLSEKSKITEPELVS